MTRVSVEFHTRTMFAYLFDAVNPKNFQGEIIYIPGNGCEELIGGRDKITKNHEKSMNDKINKLLE